MRCSGACHPICFRKSLVQTVIFLLMWNLSGNVLKNLSSEIGNFSPERLASGFLRIAVENMANAIKKISVARGYDVSRYTLVTFGGAGGQHACAVADALGMDRVFVHRFAGVLSAYGMGLAELRVLKECSIEKSLGLPRSYRWSRFWRNWRPRRERSCSPKEVKSKRSIRKFNIRYEGTNTPLAVEAGTVEDMEKAFLEAHRVRFGFVMDSRGRPLVVDSVSLEAIGRSDVQSDDFHSRKRRLRLTLRPMWTPCLKSSGS